MLFEDLDTDQNLKKAYCLNTVNDYADSIHRYETNFNFYKSVNKHESCVTAKLFETLYRKLLALENTRMEVAAEWLRKYS